jgi:pSer/pThr/pTyr-binding forkhead associated (FHA) protein
MDPRTATDVQATGSFPVATDLLPRTPAEAVPAQRPAWVDEARGGLEAPGRYLAYEDDGTPCVVPVAREWTRIGRSLSAEVRFDDATVSRRHALLVCEAGGVHVLDDRSLNGVYVNGRRVDRSPLADGDCVTVGRHVLWFLEATDVPAGAPPAAAAAG